MTPKTSRVLKTQLKLNITVKRSSRCFSLDCVGALGLDGTKQEQEVTWTETEEKKKRIFSFVSWLSWKTVFRGKGLFLKIAEIAEEIRH